MTLKLKLQVEEIGHPEIHDPDPWLPRGGLWKNLHPKPLDSSTVVQGRGKDSI
jgi:hypothetical protein